jgi:hypothetical protein
MAVLIANADGNLTGAATFAATETGANALKIVRNSTSTLTTSGTATSPTFTVTNGKVIDGVLLWLIALSGAGTGTLKVDLQKGGVSQASVTVNKSDLPDSTNATPATVFFKFTSTATGDGGSNWTIVLTATAGTGNGGVTYQRNSATAGDFTKALRTTTAATPAAGDDLFIVGELTGAATHNSHAVTMDSTAATAYGNGSVNSTTVAGGLIAVGNYGTLSYGISAATNYILRVAGDLIVYQYGTLNIGSSGAEIPRSSTAVLEFQPVSVDGDFGLQNRGGTVNIAGLSRTSGKNVVKCKLTSDVASASILTSASTAGPQAATLAATALDYGTSLHATSVTDTVANSAHGAEMSAPLTNATQTASVWLSRGSGTRNRYVRVLVGNSSSIGSVTSSFYVDVDLQAGTLGTPGSTGLGTVVSATITAVGTGYVVRLTGKVSTALSITNLFLLACSALGTTSYAGDATQNFIFANAALVNVASISDTTFSVDADTGWLSNDIVCVASTSQTAAECETFMLNADASSSALASTLYPGNASVVPTHSGTSPTQAEVGLLTRNVKIRSTSSTLMTYVYCDAPSIFNASWAEFYYLGNSSITTKRGIELSVGSTAAGAKIIEYCSVHDNDGNGIYSPAGSVSLNLVASYNVFWDIAFDAISISSTISNADYVIDNNLFLFSGSDGISLSDGLVGVLTNNTAVGCNSYGFNLISVIGGGAIGTVQNNTAHSNINGLLLGLTGTYGILDGFNLWRNVTNGLQGSSGVWGGMLFTNLRSVGNGSRNIYFSADVLNISGGVLCGDTSFTSPYGIYTQSTSLQQYNLDNVDFNPGGIYTAHTTSEFGFIISGTKAKIEAWVNNCRFGAPGLLTGNSGAKSSWSDDSFMLFQRYSQTNGDHRAEVTYGQLKTDSVIYSTAAPSMRMTPNDASKKLESAAKRKGVLVPVASGAAASISVKVRKSVSGDGAAYNGNQPRLIQRANPALGQNSDVVLATASGAAGSFETLSASTSVPTDDGCFELIVDCDGTAGFVNVDDWA